jgi:RNA polymerase sigma-B factor
MAGTCTRSTSADTLLMAKPNGYQPYNDEEIGALLAEYRRTEDARLRDAVVERMRPLVQHVARRFSGREPLEDLESEGYVGLIRAVDRFSPARGARFSTFAMHLVAGQIRHYLRDRGHLIRQPAWLQELNTKVQRAAGELEQKLQREPTVAELAAATNVSEEGIEELLSARHAARIVRMETPTDDDEDGLLEVDPEKFRSRSYVTLELPIEDRIVLEGALDRLKELERKVLYYFFYKEYNQSEIARTLGISCNYTGYVLRKGLKQMRERLPEDRTGRATGRDASVMDPLTGVYNAAHFDHRLSEEIHRSVHFDQPVAVACIVLPERTTDEALVAAAETLREGIRKADVVARTGPHEFGLIFPGTREAAPRVATRLAEKLIPIAGSPVHVATAVYPESGRTARELFEAARSAATADEGPRPAPRPQFAGA